MGAYAQQKAKVRSQQKYIIEVLTTHSRHTPHWQLTAEICTMHTAPGKVNYVHSATKLLIIFVPTMYSTVHRALCLLLHPPAVCKLTSDPRSHSKVSTSRLLLKTLPSHTIACANTFRQLLVQCAPLLQSPVFSSQPHAQSASVSVALQPPATFRSLSSASV